MARRNRVTNTCARRESMRLAARAFVVAFLLCLGSVHGWTKQQDQPQAKKTEQPQAKPSGQQQPAKPSSQQQQMKGLDEQIQEVKSDVLSIAAELSRLEEKLLYPSGTQIAVFVSLVKGDPMRLDAVRLQIDGQLVAHYIYSFKELEALRKGGVQRIYVGNVASGDHQLEVLVEGKRESGADFSTTQSFTIRKDVKPKMVGLTLGGPNGSAPITLGEW
jgi:hypothetical protein